VATPPNTEPSKPRCTVGCCAKKGGTFCAAVGAARTGEAADNVGLTLGLTFGLTFGLTLVLTLGLDADAGAGAGAAPGVAEGTVLGAETKAGVATGTEAFEGTGALTGADTGALPNDLPPPNRMPAKALNPSTVSDDSKIALTHRGKRRASKD